MKRFGLLIFALFTCNSAYADYCLGSDFKKSKSLITQSEASQQINLQNYNDLVKSSPPYGILTNAYLETWQDAGPEIEALLATFQIQEQKFNELAKSQAVVIQQLSQATNLLESLEEYCFIEDEYRRSTTANKINKAVKQALAQAEQLEFKIDRVHDSIVREIRKLKHVVKTSNIEWKSIPIQTAHRGEGWSISGGIRYQVSLKFCEPYGQISVKLIGSNISITRESAKMIGLTVSLAKNIEGGKWDIFHESEPLIPTSAKQLQTLIAPYQHEFKLNASSCGEYVAADHPKQKDPGWLVFKALMQDGAYVPIHTQIRPH
ncbi:hypothetical protein [Shewanella gelidii]|uniref:Uncharacterized protein n=1 Tax=Shewanella gelidii TaxID=1642821 RepID=A0A917JIV3_9GAMM|nr:hypothetical protein [Shewanella gelidii]MCL1096964.1 hypothetical protein [Shewanella gelidii]GGI71517.1 hypothetical protein GCM10009332_06100 [Shewanella gelidii]